MNFQILFYILGIVLAAYIIGSFPTGYLLVKAVKGIDIRKEGSGSTGATNVKKNSRHMGIFYSIAYRFIQGVFACICSKIS